MTTGCPTGRPALRRRGKTSAAKRAANRRNAQQSTGPKTLAGKARAARNARRHGLTLSARRDPVLACAIKALVHRIAGAAASLTRRERAERIAAAQTDVLRVRQARQDLYSTRCVSPDLVRRLASLERYERRARSRRKFAIRHFDAARERYDATMRFGQNEPTNRNNAAGSRDLRVESEI